MSTRKLILAALACGLAILVAGSIQLLRIKDSETVVLNEGDSTELSLLRVSVLSSVVEAGETLVTVRMALDPSATAGIEDAVVGWSLLSSGLREPLEAYAPSVNDGTACAGSSVEPGASLDCVLAFAWNPEDSGDTGFVTMRFVGTQATWALSV